MSFSSVGKVWDEASFRTHIRANASTIKRWATGVTIHHTGSPCLADRPKGWTVQHLRNLAHFYGTELRWSSGPHFFTDEDQVFGLSPVISPGVHARSFNKSHIGIEALGNYDTESPGTGRGLEVWNTTARVVAILLEELGWDESCVNFHRDDPQTSKTCPGSKVSYDWFRGLVRNSKARAPEPTKANAEARSENQETPTPAEDFKELDKSILSEARSRVAKAKWQLDTLLSQLDQLN